MFPLHDSIAPRTFPWVTYGIIALCSLAFLLQVAAGPDDNRIVEEWGMIPARVMADEVTKAELTIERPTLAHTPYGDQVVVQRAPMPSAAISDWVTLLTCMFLHGGLMHFAGNMWFQSLSSEILASHADVNFPLDGLNCLIMSECLYVA